MSNETSKELLVSPVTDCTKADDPLRCEQLKRTSKTLKELSESDANKLVVTCDEKFRNELGECEIPLRRLPHELKETDEKKGA